MIEYSDSDPKLCWLDPKYYSYFKSWVSNNLQITLEESNVFNTFGIFINNSFDAQLSPGNGIKNSPWVFTITKEHLNITSSTTVSYIIGSVCIVLVLVFLTPLVYFFIRKY